MPALVYTRHPLRLAARHPRIIETLLAMNRAGHREAVAGCIRMCRDLREEGRHSRYAKPLRYLPGAWELKPTTRGGQRGGARVYFLWLRDGRPLLTGAEYKEPGAEADEDLLGRTRGHCRSGEERSADPMTDRAKARAARLAALLNEDGTVTPAETLPKELLNEAREDLEAPYLEALTAETVGEGLHAVRVESGLETPEVLSRRGVSKGRLSQLERADLNPRLSTLMQQADALEYDVTIVFTPRDKGRRAVRVRVGG